MAHQLVPTVQDGMPARTDRAYDVVTNYKWGGADVKDGKAPYFDETARRMLLTTRSSMLDVASELVYEGDIATDKAQAQEDFKKALNVVNLLDSNLSEATDPYDMSIGATLGQIYCELGQEKRLNDKKLTDKGLQIIWNLMERYAPYLAYNRSMAMSFGNPSLTRETRYAPYQFYRFVELYDQFGGNKAKAEELVGRYGMTIEELKRNYEALMGRSSATTDDYIDATPKEADASTLAGYEEELAKYCEIANHLATLSPQDYAASSQEELMIDSVLHQALEYYFSVGGSEERMKKYPNFKNLDRARSRKLNEAYVRNHPEFNM